MALAALFQRLLELPDRAVMDVIAIVIGETLFAGSAAIEAVGLHIGLDMAKWWTADDAFFEGLRDKEVLTALVAEVAGAKVAAPNATAKAAPLKPIIRAHLAVATVRTTTGSAQSRTTTPNALPVCRLRLATKQNETTGQAPVT